MLSIRFDRYFIKASLFQIHVSLVMISETIKSLSSIVTCPIADVGVDADSQGACHNFVEFPFPMTLPRCWRMIFLPSMIPLQSCDAEELQEILRKESAWQYFPCSILESKQSGFVRSFHVSLPNKALLKCVFHYILAKFPSFFNVCDVYVYAKELKKIRQIKIVPRKRK